MTTGGLSFTRVSDFGLDAAAMTPPSAETLAAIEQAGLMMYVDLGDYDALRRSSRPKKVRTPGEEYVGR